MIHGVDSIASMNRELEIRSAAGGLKFDCGCGGLFTSQIAVVAEAPGEREEQARQPLIGGSGKLLWDVLRKDGITRNHVYMTNVVKKRLVATAESYKTKKEPITRQELDQWKNILLDELSYLPNVRYVVALGNYALWALTGEKGISNFRGSVIDVEHHGRQYKVICAVNPAAVLREPRQEIVFRMDMAKLKRVMEGKFHTPEIKCIINPSYYEALEYLDDMENAGEPIAYDIESMANETACVGFAYKNNEGICINWRSQGQNLYTLQQEMQLRLRIQKLVSNPLNKLIAQNANFDMYWMWYKDRIRVHATWFDTMLAHHLLYPSLPHGLGFLTSQYTDHPYYKDEGKEWREEGDIDSFWQYNVKDCCITRIVSEKLLVELQEQKLDQFFFNHVMKLQPHLVKMTVNGVQCDRELKDAITDRLDGELTEAKLLLNGKASEVTGISDYEFNPNSPTQLSDLFFTKLKLVGRGTSTDRENRDRILKHPRTTEGAKQLIGQLNGYLEKSKFQSTYAKSTIDIDGRFRCEYKQTGVQSAPGRLSSSGTMWGSGLNMQNIPEAAKQMFICPPGYEFSYFDMAQIEARIVAWKAGIEAWIEQFERARLEPGSYDAHCALASDMFKVPYEQVPKSDTDEAGNRTIRFIAKRCRHGLNYRMGPDRLATTTGLPISEAQKAYAIYHRTTPQIMQWWADTADEVRNNRTLHNAFGRRWILLERYDDSALDSIVAFYPQSTAGDHVAGVIYKAHEDPDWPTEASCAINVHDALIAVNRIEDGPKVRSILKKYAETPIMINGRKMIVPADFGKSEPDEHGVHRWSTIKKIK